MVQFRSKEFNFRFEYLCRFHFKSGRISAERMFLGEDKMKQESLNRHLHVLLFNAFSSAGCADGTCVPSRGFFSLSFLAAATSTPITAKKRLGDCVLSELIGLVRRRRLGMKYAVKMCYFVVMPDINRRHWRYLSSLCHPPT